MLGVFAMLGIATQLWPTLLATVVTMDKALTTA